jgi:hypothetical protein
MYMRTPNSSQRLIGIGMIPSLFCLIHSSLVINCYSKSDALTTFPPELRNRSPEVSPAALFHLASAPSTFSVSILTLSLVKMLLLSLLLFESSNQRQRYMVGLLVAPIAKYLIIPVSSIFEISSPRKALAYPKKTKQVSCATPIFLAWESPAACRSHYKTTCSTITACFYKL